MGRPSATTVPGFSDVIVGGKLFGWDAANASRTLAASNNNKGDQEEMLGMGGVTITPFKG